MTKPQLVSLKRHDIRELLQRRAEAQKNGVDIRRKCSSCQHFDAKYYFFTPDSQDPQNNRMYVHHECMHCAAEHLSAWLSMGTPKYVGMANLFEWVERHSNGL